MLENENYYVVFTPFFPSPRNFRGSYIFDQVKALQKINKYKIVVIVLNNSVSERYLLDDIIVHSFKVLDLPSFVLPGLFMNYNVSRLITFLRKLSYNNLHKISFIHGHVAYPCGLLATLVAKKIGCQSIIQHHGLDIMGYCNGRIKNELFKKVNNNWINRTFIPTINSCSWNVGVSRKTLEKLRTVPGYNSTNEYVLYNGTNLDLFYPIPNLTHPRYFVIGCIANFWPLKNQINLIKAVELLVKDGFGHIRVIFIGTGSTLKQCKLYVRKHFLEKYIEFREEVPHDRLVNFYNTLDLFVLPSYYEALGCVYLEAYACHVPFMGVLGQGIEELIDEKDKLRWLVKKDDYEQLAMLVKKQIEEKKEMKLNINTNINYLVKDFLNNLEMHI